ncbi:MAG: 2OG-Fe(II) oxygenase [Deltaproteobacteria bacterium]|nr:2OG-Fe(II) oxygenase [Deltaproteobacteria bacterium]
MNVLVPGRGRPYLDGDSLDHGAPMVWTVPGVLPAEACAALIARIEELGPTDAPVTTRRGFVMRPDIRNNTRVIFDDAELAARLFDRVTPALPPSLCGMRPAGANERFRCYRYEPGQRFAPHYDGAYVRSADEQSLLTFMVYLNDGFGGGDTTFHDHGVSARPSTGMALLFQHRLLHEGCVVTSGTKYALRSDVMYRRC